jgi:hypothetical protein
MPRYTPIYPVAGPVARSRDGVPQWPVFGSWGRGVAVPHPRLPGTARERCGKRAAPGKSEQVPPMCRSCPSPLSVRQARRRRWRADSAARRRRRNAKRRQGGNAQAHGKQASSLVRLRASRLANARRPETHIRKTCVGQWVRQDHGKPVVAQQAHSVAAQSVESCGRDPPERRDGG